MSELPKKLIDRIEELSAIEAREPFVNPQRTGKKVGVKIATEIYKDLKSAMDALEFYKDINNFNKVVWQNDKRDGPCWRESFDDSGDVDEIYSKTSTGEFGIKALETLNQLKDKYE